MSNPLSYDEKLSLARNMMHAAGWDPNERTEDGELTPNAYRARMLLHCAGLRADEDEEP